MDRLWEEFFDQLFFLCVGIGSIIVFVSYWGHTFDMYCAEAVLQEFLVESSADGCFGAEEYEHLVHNIKRIDSGLNVELEWTGYRETPVYAKLSEEQILSYYLSRNVRHKEELKPQRVLIEEFPVDIEKLQEDTNASILADGQAQYLPLQGEQNTFSVCAVRPFQRVYEGEELITLCRVYSESGVYYTEAEPVCALETGTVYLKLQTEGNCYEAEVEVECFPRKVSCDKGHIYANTKDRIEKRLGGMEVVCPYCYKLPERITVENKVGIFPVGTELSEILQKAEVLFFDGHVELVSPGMNGWQDDYDKNFCGIQTVSVMYFDVETELTIVLEGQDCLKCGRRCVGRSYPDYVSFPYCVSCMSGVELFSGEIYTEIQKKNASLIFDELCEKKVIELEKGDILVGYIRQGKRIRSVLQQIIENKVMR